jgi:hypothetical protein
MIDRDLMLAVLAMDTYHRDYNRGLSIVQGAQIGHATLANVSIASNPAANFFA